MQSSIVVAWWRLLLVVGVADLYSDGFMIPQPVTKCGGVGSMARYAGADETSPSSNTLTLTLDKPMGMLLEESVTSSVGGVYVKEFGAEGSALAFADEIRGAQVVRVGSVDVASSSFETVMDLILNDASPTIDIEFRLPVVYTVGTPVKITVQQPNGGDNLTLNAAVGDNLRQVLLDNSVEVYKGFQQTLGNCGGAGQCTFCAVDFIASEGWDERSDYESGKLKRFPTARLACLNNIQGPATIRKTQR